MKLAGPIIMTLLALAVGFLAGRWPFGGGAVDAPELTPGLSLPSMAPPANFQIESCSGAAARSVSSALTPCVLLQAGGKRLVFGAPLTQNWQAIGPLDGVFLFDGHPLSSGGLAGLRYETWFDGRNSPLLLVSGELALETVQATDQALLVPDALAEVERPELDSRRAGFAVKPVPVSHQDMLVFNTGDLQVFASTDLSAEGDQLIAYRVDYAGVRLEMASCEGRGLSFPGAPDVLLIPSADREDLTRLRDEAVSKQQSARLFEIRKIGQACPTPAQAQEIASQRGVKRLVLMAGKIETGPDDVVATLTDGAVTLYAPEFAE